MFPSGLRSIDGRTAAKATRAVADICSALTTQIRARGLGHTPRHKGPLTKRGNEERNEMTKRVARLIPALTSYEKDIREGAKSQS